MDLLVGYDSDGDASGSDEAANDAPSPATRPNPSKTGPSVSGRWQQQQPSAKRRPALAGANSEAGAAPAPSSSGRRAALAALPAPSVAGRLGGAGRRTVPLRLPFRFEAPPDSDDEDEQPRKKLKASTAGLKLAQLLPKPKNDAALGLGSGKRLDAARADSDDDEKLEARLLGASDGAGVLAGADNEAFRLGPTTDEGDADANPGAILQPPGPGAGATGPARPPGARRLPAPLPPGDEAAPDGEAMLTAALAMEARDAARRNIADPFADLGVKFVEVKQARLTAMDPSAREAANAARTALGADYEAQLRSAAGPQPDKLARRKHQISSLFHQAKMKELEMMEKRSQAMKTKAETHAKYGW